MGSIARAIAAALLCCGLCAISLAQGQPISPAAELKWKNISERYRDFALLRPILVNSGNSSVFLSRLYPQTYGHLERFNEQSKQWEPGEWSIVCGTVAKAGVPIEIKPKTEHRIDVYWRLSMDDWDHPNSFVVIPSRERRPLEGRYRFTLLYALQPWTLFQHPSATYTLTSPEFVIDPK